jgi:linoleoyl-CoA desaturase
LNFQIEHHLFPRICHVNYPAISKLVQATCKEFGVRYAEHKSLRSGLVSHYRWLRRMGLAEAAAGRPACVTRRCEAAQHRGAEVDLG